MVHYFHVFEGRRPRNPVWCVTARTAPLYSPPTISAPWRAYENWRPNTRPAIAAGPAYQTHVVADFEALNWLRRGWMCALDALSRSVNENSSRKNGVIVHKGETAAAPSLVEASVARLHSIDILRALAAFSVVMYHARVEFSLGLRETYSVFGLTTLRPDIWLSYAAGIFSFGWLGVPIFFILSGYCIHRGYAVRLSQPGYVNLSVRKFYKRRFLRIYPVYVAALALTAAVNYFLSSGQSFPEWIASNITTFALNLVMAQEMFVSTFGQNSVFWTLSIEAHLYLFYPILFYVFRRYGPVAGMAFAGAISLTTAVIYWSFDLSTVFIHAMEGSPLFTSHLLLWAAGAYLAEIHAGRAHAPQGAVWTISWVATLAIMPFLSQPVFMAWGPILLAVGAFGLVSVAIPVIDHLCQRTPLVMRPLYLMGVASYSLYATHAVVFHAIKGLFGDYRTLSVVLALACSLIAVGFSIVFFYLVERYTIRARPR